MESLTQIEEVLPVLAKRRPLFHSEADFQHALAWELHQQLPAACVRLEVPLQVRNQFLHIDIWAIYQGAAVAVELKYKTRGLSIRIGDEQYRLRSQRAQDVGRYDFLKDIQRLEQVRAQHPNLTAYAILLTNDSLYWTRPANFRTVDADFRLYEGRVIEGMLAWGHHASEGTKKNRERPIVLRGRYCLRWTDYSRVSSDAYGEFRSLAVRVE